MYIVHLAFGICIPLGTCQDESMKIKLPLVDRKSFKLAKLSYSYSGAVWGKTSSFERNFGTLVDAQQGGQVTGETKGGGAHTAVNNCTTAQLHN